MVSKALRCGEWIEISIKFGLELVQGLGLGLGKLLRLVLIFADCKI